MANRLTIALAYNKYLQNIEYSSLYMLWSRSNTFQYIFTFIISGINSLHVVILPHSVKNKLSLNLNKFTAVLGFIMNDLNKLNVIVKNAEWLKEYGLYRKQKLFIQLDNMLLPLAEWNFLTDEIASLPEADATFVYTSEIECKHEYVFSSLEQGRSADEQPHVIEKCKHCNKIKRS